MLQFGFMERGWHAKSLKDNHFFYFPQLKTIYLGMKKINFSISKLWLHLEVLITDN